MVQGGQLTSRQVTWRGSQQASAQRSRRQSSQEATLQGSRQASQQHASGKLDYILRELGQGKQEVYHFDAHEAQTDQLRLAE